SLQNTCRKPNSPSSTLEGPVKPSPARLAASMLCAQILCRLDGILRCHVAGTPLSAARPRWRRLTMAPLPVIDEFQEAAGVAWQAPPSSTKRPLLHVSTSSMSKIGHLVSCGAASITLHTSG